MANEVREVIAAYTIKVDSTQIDKARSKLKEFAKALKDTARAKMPSGGAGGAGGGGGAAALSADGGIDVGGSLGGISSAFGKVMKAAVIYEAAKAIYSFADSVTASVFALRDQSAILGISIERVQQFEFAAKAMGFDNERILFLMGRLEVAQGEAAKGAGKFGEKFSQLGVSIHGAGGELKKTDELLLDTADAFSKIQNPSKRAALATELFGRSGRQMIPFLMQGKKGISELFKIYKDLGGGYTEEAQESARRFAMSQAKLGLQLDAMKDKILKNLVPTLEYLGDKIGAVATWFMTLAKNSSIVQAALAIFGIYIAGFGIELAIANAPLLAIIAGLTLLWGLFDDIITMFRGGQSVIGETLDEIFGKGFSAQGVKDIKEMWNGIMGSIGGIDKGVVHDLKELMEIMLKVAKTGWTLSGKFGDALFKGKQQLDETFFTPEDNFKSHDQRKSAKRNEAVKMLMGENTSITQGPGQSYEDAMKEHQDIMKSMGSKYMWLQGSKMNAPAGFFPQPSSSSAATVHQTNNIHMTGTQEQGRAAAREIGNHTQDVINKVTNRTEPK